MFALFFLHFVQFFSDWLNFVAQELKPKEKIYLVNKLHASCRLSHSAHVKTLRKTIIITKEKKYQRRFFGRPGAVVTRRYLSDDADPKEKYQMCASFFLMA